MSKANDPISRRQTRQYVALAAAAEQVLTTLSAETTHLVRSCWNESNAAPGEFAAELYAHLFALAPEAARLFPGDLTHQRQRLTRTLSESLALLDTPQELLLLLKASGVRHVHYHTEFGHFPLLGSALGIAFEQRLGERFTRERREAWHLYYTSMAAVMCGAMAATLMER